MSGHAKGRLARSGGLILLSVAAVALGVYAVRFAAISRVEVLRSDYLIVDTAGNLLRDGLGTQLYVDQVQGPVYTHLAAGDHKGDLLFNHAPLSAAIAVPFSFLSQVAGHDLYGIVQLAMVALGCALVARAAPWPPSTSRVMIIAAVLAALAGAGTLPLLLQGQEVGEITLCLGAAYTWWRRDRLALGAAALVVGAAIAKPHLALGLLAFLIGWRDRRLLLGAAAGGAAAAGVSLLLVGWQGVAGFVSVAVRSTTLYPSAHQYGITGFFGALLGAGVPASSVSIASMVLALTACFALGRWVRHDRARLDLAVAAATALSLLAAPHLLAHDIELLAPMFVVMLAVASARDGAAVVWPGPSARTTLQAWLMLAIATGLDETTTLPLKLTPMALTVFALICARWTARQSTRRNVEGDARHVEFVHASRLPRAATSTSSKG